jgi:hypothetical protein
MKVFIDKDFKCHLSDDGTMTAVETPFFDGKCAAFIEGYRFIPADDSWVGENGVVFEGEMISPWQDYNELEDAQRAYERQLLAEYETLINELYSEVTAE